MIELMQYESVDAVTTSPSRLEYEYHFLVAIVCCASHISITNQTRLFAKLAPYAIGSFSMCKWGRCS